MKSGKLRIRNWIAMIELLCFTATTYSQNINFGPATRASCWQQDLDFLETNLPQTHISFYKFMSKEKFEQEMADIKKSAPQLSDSEIVLRLVRLTASLGIAHTQIGIPTDGPLAFHRYPVWTRWFSDGLGVVAAATEYQDALGARVVRIGTMTPDQLEAKLAPFISHENKIWLHEESPNYMAMPELLQHLKVADADGVVELTLVKAGGKPFTLRISPTDWSGSGKKIIGTADFLHIPSLLYHKNPNAFYWYEYLPDMQTLYIQYRVCENDPKNPFKNFAGNLFALADSNSVQRVVVDLRFNNGGDSRVINPLCDGILSRPALNAKGHFFVLIGPVTFSSGEMAAEGFHNSFSETPGSHFNATLVGEPTGGKPNGYGEVKIFKLPNSKLQVACSTKYFRPIKDGDPPSLQPDVTVTRSWEDYLAGRDPVLEAVLHFH
jgi:hypothetical protein